MLVFTFYYSRLLALIIIVLLASGNVQRRIGDRQADRQDDIVKQVANKQARHACAARKEGQQASLWESRYTGAWKHGSQNREGVATNTNTHTLSVSISLILGTQLLRVVFRQLENRK